MIRFFCIIAAVLLFNAVEAQETKPGNCMALSVSANHRYLMTGDQPFFWLGDTGWLLLSKLSRSDAEKYLQDRKEKGFNVIQVMVLHSLSAVNIHGDSALIRQNVATPTIGLSKNRTGYWKNLDDVIDLAAEKGIYMALVPIWGSNVKAGKVNAKQAEIYAGFLAKRYKDKSNVIWLNGGDVRGSDSIQVWKTIGSTLKKFAPNQLVTYHPFGRTQSSTWFHQEPWLDFNMFQSGHRRYDQDTARAETRYGEDNWRYVADDYQKLPVKPTLDGEPSYEGIPQGLHDTLQARWKDSDIRRYAYWSVFSGACGFTYGHNSVMQFYTSGPTAGDYGAREPWTKAVNSPGANQMKHLRDLMLKYRFQELVPIAGCGEKYDYQPILRDEKYVLVYTFNGRDIQLKPDVLSGHSFELSWYSPRDGGVIRKGKVVATEATGFDPPGTVKNGNDWVMILERSNLSNNAKGK